MRAIRSFARQHPRLVSWVILSLGMALIVLAATQDKGLTAAQVAWMVVLCVFLAGTCALLMGR